MLNETPHLVKTWSLDSLRAPTLTVTRRGIEFWYSMDLHVIQSDCWQGTYVIFYQDFMCSVPVMEKFPVLLCPQEYQLRVTGKLAEMCSEFTGICPELMISAQ